MWFQDKYLDVWHKIIKGVCGTLNIILEWEYTLNITSPKSIIYLKA